MYPSIRQRRVVATYLIQVNLIFSPGDELAISGGYLGMHKQRSICPLEVLVGFQETICGGRWSPRPAPRRQVENYDDQSAWKV